MIGFVLIFGIVVSTVAIVYVGGTDALRDARNDQRFANTERAFDVLDSNVEDLAVRGARSRATELLLSDGALEFGAPVTFNISAGGGNYYATTVTPLVYRADSGRKVVYSNGALFRQYGDDAAMFDAPRIAVGDRAVVPYVITRAASSNVSTIGTRRVLVRTAVQQREVRVFSNVSANLTVTSPRARAWQRYLEDELGVDCDGPEDGRVGEVECPLPAEDIYVQALVVEVRYA